MAFGSLSVGEAAPRESGRQVLARARERSALLPDLLVEAQRIANTVTLGWHGRKRRGPGDDFWQFRPYDPSEGMSRIDWRRSARDEQTYVRDREWEAAHTVWVWADESPSMLFKSRTAMQTKQSRAMVLALALADTLSRSGERIGWPGVTRAIAARNAAERICAELAGLDPGHMPPTDAMRSGNELVVVSDFLDPRWPEHLELAARNGVHGSLLHVIDPAEETFPYRGRTEFRDPETGAKLTFGRAESLSGDYAREFAAHKNALRALATRLGWNHVVHHTDRLASEALVALHIRLSDASRRSV